MKQILIFKIVLTLSLSSLLVILLAEIALRFLPVTLGIKGQLVTIEQPLLCFEPNSDFTYSVGPLLQGGNQGKINNYGLVNDIDYDANATSPLLAVVGDSYIEALLVPFEETLHGQLSRSSSNRVYSFGVSGSPLSQYLGYCRYLRDHFKPSAIIINVVGNDFDESLFEYKNAPGYHYFHSDNNKELYNKLVPNQKQTHLLGFIPTESYFATILRESRLMQYLYKNAKIMSVINNAKIYLSGRNTKNSYVGNTAAHHNESRSKKSKLAVDAFFRDLPVDSNLSSQDVIFTVDGLRQSIYEKSLRKSSLESYFGLMRKYFIERAQSLGYEVVDLDNVFMSEYEISKKNFEPAYDGHWNSYAHGIVAEEVMKTSLWNRFSEKRYNSITP